MVHRGFIEVGYDGGQYVREEEHSVERERASRIPRGRVLLATLALAGAVVGVIVYGYLARPGWIGVSDKKFWDYLELLIVPAALALGVYLLNRAQSEREREADEAQQRRERMAEEDRREREREAEAAQRERELEVENQRAQDDALQAYLDQMSQLLTDKDRPLHQAHMGDSLSTVARARTLTVLTRLDGVRKRSVLQFLYESYLITRDRCVVDLSGADLSGAQLSEADLSNANLIRADLRGVNLNKANLSRADLSRADLRGVNLNKANLSRADLLLADLSGADLTEAQLWGAYMLEANLHDAGLTKAKLIRTSLRRANLRGADLGGADLSGADLRGGANLGGADLSGADLRGADLSNVRGVTNEELEQQARSLEGATMGNTQKYEDWRKKKYEDWLKSKGRGEDKKNA